MKSERRSWNVIFILAMTVGIASLAMPAAAIPVDQPFGSFPKAIVFDPANVPAGAYPIIIADGDNSSAHMRNGAIMTPLGDGSWILETTVYPGSSYKFHYEFRIPEYEADSIASFRTTEPNGQRNQDIHLNRLIRIPAAATDGYVIYAIYGTNWVHGAQGDSSMTANLSNPFLASLPPNFYQRETELLTQGTPTWHAPYNLTVTQISPSRALLSWEYSIGGDGFAAQVEGASRFLPSDTPAYGFQIWRAESMPIRTWSNVSESVVGTPIYSDNDNNPFNNAILFIDTSIVAHPDSTFIYVIRSKDAYGSYTYTMNNSDSVTWADLAAEVDGAVDLMYGPPIATDPKGDQSLANLDLTRMWATRDAVNLYSAIEIGANIFSSGQTWGRYFVLIDVTGDSTGAPDLLHADLGDNRKNITFAGKRPEYALVFYSTDRDNIPPDKADLYRWTGAGWTNLGSQLMAAATNNETSWIEAAIPLASLTGFSGRVWLEGFATGNDALNLPRDVINRLEGEAGNNEYNSEEWTSGTPAAISVSTPFPPPLTPPIAVSITAFDTRAYFSFMPPAMNPALFARLDVFFDSDYAKVASGDSRVRRAQLPADATLFETTGLIPGVRYYASVFAVASDGESAGSSVPYCDIRISDTITMIRHDSSGLTIIEVAKDAIRPAYATDTFFRIEIINFDELYQLANFTDTARAAQLNLVRAANEKIFYDPNFNLVSTGNYPDTPSPLRQIRVIRPDGSTAPADYFIEVRLRIPYLTVDGQHLSGASLFHENRLVIRKLDEGRNEWVIPSTEKTQWVMVDSDQVAIVTSEFSIWDVLAAAGAINDLSRLTVYPNPFNTREYIAKGHPMPPRITFAFIPLSTERIEIFNVAGERVRTLNPQDATEFVTQGGYTTAIWDAKNDFGRDVASGVYIFWVRAAGQTKIGKVAVIR